MRHPIHIVKIVWLLLLLLLFLMSVTMTARAAEAVALKQMVKEETPSRTRITLELSDLPKFSTVDSGQRLDLLLSNVQLSPDLHRLPEDERIVKILLAEKKEELQLSILLRRPPKNIITEPKQNPARIMINIYWDANESTRPSVAFRIADMPPRKAGRRASKFQQESPWKDNWDNFSVTIGPIGSCNYLLTLLCHSFPLWLQMRKVHSGHSSNTLTIICFSV